MSDETTPAAADALGWKFPLHVQPQPGPYALDREKNYALLIVHAANSKPSGGPEYEAMRARLRWVVETLNGAEEGRERTTEPTTKECLNAELIRRMWTLFDAAKVISERGDATTPDEWAAFHIAVCDIPESQHP